MSAQTRDVTVQVQALDGTWETLGADRARGVWPENVLPAADRWGPSSLSFDLRRDPGVQWPDVSAFTPIEVEIAGALRWSGRVKETPTRDGDDMVMGVQAEGWQFHLDDDVYQRMYLATRLADFVDTRSRSTADLNIYRSNGTVSDSGGVMMGWPQGSNVQNLTRVGVTFDAGPGQTVSQVIYEVTYRNSHSATMDFCISGSNGESPSSGEEVIVATNVAAASGETTAAITGATFSTPRRYVHAYIKMTGGDTTATAGEMTAKLRSILLSADSTFTAANASVMKADQVVVDAIARGTTLLSSDLSQVVGQTFSIPQLNPGEPRTPREYWDGVDAYHDNLSQIDVWRRPVFKAQPTVAIYEVGEWSAMEFEDASANSGQEIYNRALVTAQTPTGEQLTVARYAAATAPATQTVAVASPSLANPSFDTNTTGWTHSGSGSFTRQTGSFDSSPASGLLSISGMVTGTVSSTFTGTFLQGVPYTLKFAASVGLISFGVVEFGKLTTSDKVNLTIGAKTAWTTFYLTWIPTVDQTSVDVRVTVTGSAPTAIGMAIDSFQLLRSYSTLVDRRGFQRTKILQVPSTLASDGVAAAQIGDTWLAAHRTTPFRGTLKITGPDSIRDIRTGKPVPPDQMLTSTGQMLRFSDRVDPDTGAFGRDGRIAAASYDPSTDTATVTIDSSRAAFDALLARLAVVTGAGR